MENELKFYYSKGDDDSLWVRQIGLYFQFSRQYATPEDFHLDEDMTVYNTGTPPKDLYEVFQGE